MPLARDVVSLLNQAFALQYLLGQTMATSLSVPHLVIQYIHTLYRLPYPL